MRLTPALLTLALSSPALAEPVAVIDGTPIAVETLATGLDQPVALASPPADDRLFIVLQTGRILIHGQPEPFLDIAGRIAFGGEQGLLGLAFAPDFATSQRFFVTYTAPDGALTLAQGSASAPQDLRVLAAIPHDKASNHNGGWISFGPDGLLYWGTGDGGRGGDPWGNAQNPDVLLGKMLRLDPSAPSPQPEIFALGLRNPWRASWDGPHLYIADVGQNAVEEINLLTPKDAGANLGWNITEGTACFKAATCDTTGLTQPLFTYGHDLGCSVTGGYVYRGTALPALRGRYLFSDFCSGTLMSFRLSDGKATDPTNGSTSLGQITSFGQDSKGEVYILTLEGTLSKLVPE